MDTLLSMTHWTWLVLGLVMLVVELLAPMSFFLWLGVAALVTAAVAFVAPGMGWEAHFLVFSVLSVLSIWLSRRFLVKRQTRSEVPHLNRRAQQYVGRTFNLAEPITNGYGKISVDDTQWKVKGPDLPRGANVRATGFNGSVLTVEPVDD